MNIAQTEMEVVQAEMVDAVSGNRDGWWPDRDEPWQNRDDYCAVLSLGLLLCSFFVFKRIPPFFC